MRTRVEVPAVPEDALWEPATEALYLYFAGRPLKTIEFPALVLTTPFTRLSTNLEETAPRWKAFPSGVEVAVAPAQPVDAPDGGRINHSSLSFQAGFIRSVSSVLNRYYVDLRGTFDGYLEKFNSKERHNIQRRVKKLGEASGGKPDVREFHSPDELREFYKLAAGVSKNSWHEQNGGRSFERIFPLEKSIAEAARGYMLFQNQQPVAYIFCRDNHEMLLHSHTAYDEAFKNLSPGMALNFLMLESLFAEQKYSFLDFGQGVLAYKEFFATHHMPCITVRYFRRTLRNAIILSTDAALTSVSTGGGRLLKAMGVKRALKKLVMGSTARPGQV